MKLKKGLTDDDYIYSGGKKEEDENEDDDDDVSLHVPLLFAKYTMTLLGDYVIIHFYVF